MPNSAIGDQLAGVLELGSALIVATVAPDGEPRATRASAWRMVSTGRVWVAVSADDPVIVDNLSVPGARIAVTGADVTTLRSIQLKGRVVGFGELDAADLDLVERHNEVFVTKIESTDGHPASVVRRFLPHRLLAVEIDIDEAFNQTPGPAAGSEMWGT